MKNILKKGLEVPTPINRTEFISEVQLKEAARAAILEAIEPRKKVRSYWWSIAQRSNITGTLELCLKEKVTDLVEREVQQCLDEILTPEKFIDDVVERLNR